jgi:hypothetical protein
MFRQDRANPSTAVSNWRGNRSTPKAWPSTAVSTWLNAGLFGTVFSYVMGSRAAYYCGGYGNSTRLDEISRLGFDADAVGLIATTLSSGRSSCNGGFANSGTAGYSSGGYDGSSSQAVDKILFSDETRTSLSAGLSTARRQNPNGGYANSGTAGYVAGGSGPTTVVDKWAFSDDSRSTLGTGLNVARYDTAAFANSGTKGYVAGGQGTAVGANQGIQQSVETFAMPGDARSVLSATLTMNGNFGNTMLLGLSNSGTAGYTAGGYATNSIDRIEKWTYSGDTQSVLSAVLNDYQRAGCGAADSGTAGYWMGGNTWSPAHNIDAIDKLTFSGETIAALAGTLNTASSRGNAFANTAGL